MEAALRSANHEARLLRTRLSRALQNADGPLSMNAARAVTTFVLAESSNYGGLDVETALQLSTSIPPSISLNNVRASHNETGTLMDIEGDESVAGAETLKTSTPGTTGVPATTLALCEEERNNTGKSRANTTNAGNASNGDVVVNRKRLIERVLAEERLSAMANHLGCAEPINRLWLAPSLLRHSQSVETVTPTLTKESVRESSLSTTAGVELPPLDGFDRRQGKAAKRRAHSAEDAFFSQSQPSGTAVGPAVDEGHGRRKRSRGNREGAESKNDSVGRKGVGDGCSMLGRSKSFAMGQRHQPLPENDAILGSSCPSLPKLKASRLNG